MLKTILSQTKGYQWYSENGISFRGYFQFLGEDIQAYKGHEAIKVFEGISSLDMLKKLLEKIDGCFSIIINRDSYTLAAVDKARSLPLYFSSKFISDSAEEIRIAEGIDKEAVNKDLYLEFTSNCFLFGHNTVYTEIKQLDLGEAVQIFGNNQNYEFCRYFYHITKIEDQPINEIKKELTGTSERVFKRLKEVIADRPVVLSLSGGYDSRFVACMLKSVGVSDVSCYTYGKKDNHEVIQSKKVADALGYRWICVEMTDELMRKQLDNVGMDYIDSFTGHDYSCYFQNFPAVRKLHEEGWFKPNSVFLTGLCGDMPTGCYIREEIVGFNYDTDYAASTIYDMLFNSFKMGEVFKNNWINKMKYEIESLPIHIKDYETWQSAVDCIYTGTCHSHAYMHMNSAHSFFGYEWLLPFWDKELLQKWYSIPPRYKIHQALYEDWLLNDICTAYGIGDKKQVVGYTDVKWKRRLLYPIGGGISFILLHLGFPIRRRADFNNFCIIELGLFKMLRAKKYVKFMKAGIMHMICYFSSERRYGSKNLNYFYNNCKVRIN